MLLLLLVTAALSFPSVQTKVAQEATQWANEQYDINADLEKLRYVFPNEVRLGGVYLPDEQGDTLIYAHELIVNVGGYSSVTGTLGLQAVEADSLKFYLLTKKGDSTTNLNQFIAKFGTPDTTKESKPFNMDILDISLSNSRFWLENLNCDSNCTGFKIVDINTSISSFKLDGANFNLDVNSLSANDLYGLAIEELWGEYAYGAESMVFTNLHLKTNRSLIEGDYSMYYSSIADMSDYVNKVTMEADLKPSSISSEDIQHFAPVFPAFKTIELKGIANGVVNDLDLKDLEVKVGNNTKIAGDLKIDNATTVDKLTINTPNFYVQSEPDDIRYFYGLFANDTLPSLIDSLKTVSYDGEFNGLLTSFYTKGLINSGVGEIETDLKLSTPKNEPVAYDGKLDIKSLQLGKLLGTNSVGKLVAKLTLKGKGFEPKTMKTDLKGKVKLIEANNYGYQNVNIDGKIAAGHFIGALNIKDPNLKFGFNGDATFTGDVSSYDFVASVQKADLHALKLVDEKIALVTGELDISLTAKDYEHWTGELRLAEVTYENPKNFYFFEDVVVTSKDSDTAKVLTVESNILDARLAGDYTYTGLADAFTHEVAKYMKRVKSKPPPVDERFDFNFTVENAQILTQIFVPELSIDASTTLGGSYNGAKSNLQVNFSSPNIAYAENRVQGIDLAYEGSSSKSQLGFDINKVALASGLEIDSVHLGNFYYNDTLFYNLKAIFKDSVDGKAQISGYALQSDTNNFEFGVFRSPFNVGYQSFEILPDNKILIDTGGVYIDNFRIVNGDKKISVNGNVSSNPNEILRLNLQGFGMSLINYFLATPEARFKGNLYGDVILSQLLEKPRFAADMRIDSLKMNKTALGDFSLTSDWTLNNDTIYLGAKMVLGALKTFEADGYYQADSTGSIDFDVNFERFRMAALNPFLSSIAENVRGFLNGSIKVSGPVVAPEISGGLELPKTAFTISFLQTDYNFEGVPKVKFTKNEIVFPDLKLRDSKYGTKGKLTGKVTHNNFKDFKLNLDIKADELLVLNTPGTSDDAYYGTAFASGVISMKGSPAKLNVTANVTTERKTKFNIPLGGARTETQTSFVQFVDYSNPDTSLPAAEQRFNLDKGIALDFDINVNENADLSIILDERTGNKLDATGNGNVRMDISRAGELELFGTYTIKEGLYNFNLRGFLNKEFEVQEGSSVTFNGSPFDAILDLTAKYSTRADPSPVVPSYTGGRVLTEVYLRIEGSLDAPKITFDIETPRASALVQTVVRNIGTGDNKTDQVFALLATNTFIPESGVSSGGTNSISGFDILANQAASTLNKLSDRFDFNFNYQSGVNNNPSENINSREELELGVSTRFLDDRVTVSTSLGVPVGDNQSNVAGEVQVEYSITKDGRFRAKAFNRELENSIVNQNTYQQGVGVFYRIDFNDSRDFWRKLRGKEEKKASVENNSEEDTNSEDQ